MSFVDSSFQHIVPGSLMTSAPLCLFACQIANFAPCRSWIVAILPTSITSNGSARTFAPSDFAFFAVSSALATATYYSQTGLTLLFQNSAQKVLPFLCSIMLVGKFG